MSTRAAVSIVVLFATACSSASIEESPPRVHAPLECTFEVDAAFPKLELAGGHAFTWAWDPAVTAEGVVYVPIQRRLHAPQYLTGVARFDGNWRVETFAERFQQIGGVAASSADVWLWGELESREAVLLRRRDGTWSRAPLPDGARAIARIATTQAETHAIALFDGTTALFRLDGDRWTAISLPWEASPSALAVIGGTVLVGAAEGTPSASRARLGRVDGDRVVDIDVPEELPTISAITGTGLHDLLVLAEARVQWIDAVSGRTKLVHQDHHPYADLWSPRPGVGLLTPGTVHGGRVTVLDGRAGPRSIELLPSTDTWSIGRIAAAGDGETVHLLAVHAPGAYTHLIGRCP